MHPYGGISTCPRCEKRVYAAEQIMGPGRMLYHKPCLACMTCSKRLDSLSLVEHDHEPYCKQCYNKNFGPQDLRQANLPHRDDFQRRMSMSPVRQELTGSPLKSPLRSMSPTQEERDMEERIERAKRGSVSRVESPSSFQTKVLSKKAERGLGRTDIPNMVDETAKVDALSLSENDVDDAFLADGGTVTPVNELEGSKDDCEQTPERTQGIPRTIPLTPAHTTRAASAATPAAAESSVISARPTTPTSPSPSSWAGVSNSPLRPTATGTRYGAGILGSPKKSMPAHDGPSSPLRPTATGTRYGAGLLGSPNKSTPASPLGTSLGGGTPLCARCTKPVYFAEQVKASGRTFHRPCLRCTDCNTSLDSSRLAEKGDRIVCRNCYSKNYGPQGSGYALLGKAGA